LSSIRFLAAAVLAASLSVPVAAFAQQAPTAPAGAAPAAISGHHGRHNNAFRSALHGLNLSASQKTQIDQIFAQAHGQNKGADPATRKANREKLHAQIEGVLTPSQRADLKAAMQQARRANRPS